MRIIQTKNDDLFNKRTRFSRLNEVRSHKEERKREREKSTLPPNDSDINSTKVILSGWKGKECLNKLLSCVTWSLDSSCHSSFYNKKSSAFVL